MTTDTDVYFLIFSSIIFCFVENNFCYFASILCYWKDTGVILERYWRYCDVLMLPAGLMFCHCHSPATVGSGERRGPGGPLSRQAGATLRPVTVSVLPSCLPPHLSITEYQEINKPFLSWNVFKTYCFIISLQPCVLIPNIDTVIVVILSLCCNTLLLLYNLQLTSTS